ncbi:MAG: EAL domain-containing protein [Sulfurimonas sp.]|uniref:EAL domain-containing protein n=1 Tax=Sulfurimonas sp. TaxID=2022749 RepID=UPI0025D2CE68|nr:EAL domain-containing protein [Sulfurimonas sp.]MCK9491016.1 EAL domain-containing protein [Sulfurimonas sp.]
MNTPQKTKQKTLLLSISVLLVSWIVGYAFLNYQFTNSINEELEKITNSTQKLFKAKLTENSLALSLKLDEIISSEGLAKAVANEDYQELDAIVSPYYERLKIANKDIEILTFRSADGMTIYRAHKREFRGDELNKKRTLIVDTNNMQRSFSGFEVGKFEMTYRTTQAIFYKKQYVGNVELGVSPRYFIKDLGIIFDIEVGMAIKKSISDLIIEDDKVFIDENYNLIRGSQTLKNYFTDKESMPNFKVNMNIPLQNHLSQTLGYLIVGLDSSEIVNQNRDFMYKLLFMGILVAILLVIVLHKSFNMMLDYFKKKVFIDHLTGLKNRQALNIKLYSGEAYVLILSNIKEFSLLNEIYGIDVGNEVLIQVAREHEKFAKANGFNSYRISADEYVLLREEKNIQVDIYTEILDKLHHKINNLSIYVPIIEETLRVEIYSGVSFDHELSLEQAQMAIKKAKEKALPYLAYSQNVDSKKSSQHILGMKKIIRHALDNKNVIPFFQPITDRDGVIIKYEALVRIINFENGKKNIIFPDDFLAVAIKSGLYIDVAHEVLSQALEVFATRPEKISINLLPNDFFNYSLMDKLVELITTFNSPQKIVLEITEQEGIEDFDRLHRAIKEFRRQGVLIAIDDFGSGYANYAHILKIRPDYLKIDGSLIKNILEDQESQILVKSIIRFAKDLKTKTVAEFVESKEIYELLKEYGVDEFQGYYFGRPKDFINNYKEIEII